MSVILAPRKSAALVAIIALSVYVAPSVLAEAATPPAPALGSAATLPVKVAPSKSPGYEATQDANGISFDAPKVFDNRSLTLMLEAWNDELRNKQFVDAAKLAMALGTLQGSRAKEFISNLSAQTVGLPSVSHEITDTAGSATAPAGPTTNNNLVDKTITNQAAVSPSIPTLEATSILPAITYGMNSVDLLADQANLTYQVFNLRMLLERSLSDRLLQSGKPRLQAVLGFNVSIKPPEIANDAAAVFEVTVTSSGAEPDGLSVVAQMAQERAYGASSLDTKSNSYGGAAVVKVVQIGYNQRSRDQTYFLYRDNDTTSYQRAGRTPNETTFGWVFRPVLGRRSVSSEPRQLFAVMALPEEDEASAAAHLAKLSVVVRTSWRKFNRNDMTTETGPDANRRTRTWRFLSFSLGTPRYLDPAFRFESEPREIAVPFTAFYQRSLGPRIHALNWVPVGQKSALLTLEGENLFSGTQVILGDKPYASVADGLVIKSSRTVEVLAPIGALMDNRGVLMGRYGSSVPLRLGDPTHGLPTPGVAIDQLDIGESLSGARVMDVWLRGRGTPDSIRTAQLPTGVALSVNGNAVLPPYRIFDGQLKRTDSHGKLEVVDRVILQTTIPDSFLRSGAADVQVTWPFRPDHWTDTKRRYDPDSAYSVERISADAFMIRTTDPQGFQDIEQPKAKPGDPTVIDYWKVRLEEATLIIDGKAPGKGAAGEKVSSSAIWITGAGSQKKVVLISPYGTPFVLTVPKAEETPKKEEKPTEITQNDSVWLELKVADPTNVVEVVAESTRPDYFVVPADDPEKKPSSIKIHLVRAITHQFGSLDISFKYKDGKTKVIPIKILEQEKKQKPPTP